MSANLNDTLVAIDRLFEKHTSIIARDIKLNLNRLLSESSLSPAESLLTLLAVAQVSGCGVLVEIAVLELKRQDLSEDQIQEARESGAIMAMLNTYYKFRNYVGKDEEYRNAGLRMTALARPTLGKLRFEMLAFAISVLNGCETCVKAHEKVLREHGFSADQVHDVARMTSVVKAASLLI